MIRIYKDGELNKQAIFTLIKECLLKEHCKNDMELASCLLSKIQELGLNVKKVFVSGYPVTIQVAGRYIRFDAKTSKSIVATLQHNRFFSKEEHKLEDLITDDEELPF